MSELNENMTETKTEDLGDVMDTNISGGAMEFVKENATGVAILCMAGYGAYQLGAKACSWVKSKIPAKEDKKPSLKERLAAKKAQKKDEEKKPKEET